MSILDQALEDQLKELGDTAVTKLQDLLNAKAGESTVAWQKSIYALLSLSVGTYGPTGVAKTLDALQSMLDGESPDFDWDVVDLEIASDVLARMQNQDADANTANHEFLIQVGVALKTMVQVILAVI
jgi:hypothetical protein